MKSPSTRCFNSFVAYLIDEDGILAADVAVGLDLLHRMENKPRRKPALAPV